MGQSARILPIHVKEGDKRGKSTFFYHFRKRQELGHENLKKECTKNRIPKDPFHTEYLLFYRLMQSFPINFKFHRTVGPVNLKLFPDQKKFTLRTVCGQ